MTPHQVLSPQTGCAQGGLQATRAKQSVPRSWQPSPGIELVWERLRAVQRAQSSPPCWREALLSTSGSSPAQHCEGPSHASDPTESTCAAAMPSRWLPLNLLWWRKFQLPRKFCTDVPKTQKLLLSQACFYFYSYKERCETIQWAQACAWSNCLLSTSGPAFRMPFQSLRPHVLSHGCWEVAPKSHGHDTYSRFINLWTLFQSNDMKKVKWFLFLSQVKVLLKVSQNL